MIQIVYLLLIVFFDWAEITENEPRKLGIMEGTIVAKHVWCLPSGRRIIVHFNEYDQPIRRGGDLYLFFFCLNCQKMEPFVHLEHKIGSVLMIITSKGSLKRFGYALNILYYYNLILLFSTYAYLTKEILTICIG